jgi:hypothetical protein
MNQEGRGYNRMSNSNSWNLDNLNLSEDKINKNIKETSKQIKQDVNFLLNMIKKYDSLKLLKLVAFHTDEVLEQSKINKNIHHEEVAYSQLLFTLKYVASNPNNIGNSKDLSDFSWKKFNRVYSNFENHLIKYTDNLILRENVDSSIRARMQDKFYSYMFPIPRTKFENIANKKKLLKLLLQPYVDMINKTFNSGLDNVLDSLELMDKVGTKGIYDLNKDCDLFAKRSQSKIDEIKISGTNKSNKELMERIISEEGWQNWINSLQSRSEELDLFDVQRITKMVPEELEMLSVAASSQYSDNFCWLTESAGLDNSLFIKVNDKYYSFDGMFIFDKAYYAIKKAVIKKFPGYENTWNSVEKEKSGLLPVSIFAGVFGHFNYSLNYEIEDSFFTAFFENEKGNVYVQVPMQNGYNIPLNPIKEIVLTEYAFKSYDLSVKDFDKIDSSIVVLDSLDEKTDKIIKDGNVYYISYSYLASILNDWNEIRLLRDSLLGASPENIERSEEEGDEKVLEDSSKTEGLMVEEEAEEIVEIGNSSVNKQSEETDEELEYLEELFDEEIKKNEVENSDKSENKIETIEECSEVVEDNIDDLFISNVDGSESEEVGDDSKEPNKVFSFFDVLNNVAQGKEPLNARNELSEDENIEEVTEEPFLVDNTDVPKSENLTKGFSMSNVLNNVAKGKQPLEKLDKPELVELENIVVNSELEEIDESPKTPVKEEPKPSGFSFFDVLNNVAGGKNPLTGEEEERANEKNENDDSMLDKTEASTKTYDENRPTSVDMNELVETDLNFNEKPVDLSNIEKLLDDEDDDFIDEEEDAELEEVERSDDALRELFDDDSNDERDFISDYLLSEVELNSIVEPEYEDEEVQEAPIDDIIVVNDALEENNDELDPTLDTPEEIRADVPYNAADTVKMMNSVNEILATIDDSDLDDYGTATIDEEDDDEVDDDEVDDDEVDDDEVADDEVADDEVADDEVAEEHSSDLRVEHKTSQEIENKITNEDIISFIESEKIQMVPEEEKVPFDEFRAIEENRIIEEEEVPTIESLWPASIIEIVEMSDRLDESPFFNICKVNDIELLKAIDHLIGKALDSQKIDGKDKMFTIPESNLTIVLPTNKNDQLKRWERMNSLGSLMYSKDMDSWNSLTLTYNEDKKLKFIREWRLTKDSYSPVDWKFVVTTGSKLKKNNKK